MHTHTFLAPPNQVSGEKWKCVFRTIGPTYFIPFGSFLPPFLQGEMPSFHVMPCHDVIITWEF